MNALFLSSRSYLAKQQFARGSHVSWFHSLLALTVVFGFPVTNKGCKAQSMWTPAAA